jgi:hypothetical protein
MRQNYELYYDRQEEDFDVTGMNVVTVAGMSGFGALWFETNDADDALTVNGALNFPDLGNIKHNQHTDYAWLTMGYMFGGSSYWGPH